MMHFVSGDYGRVESSVRHDRIVSLSKLRLHVLAEASQPVFARDVDEKQMKVLAACIDTLLELLDQLHKRAIDHAIVGRERGLASDLFRFFRVGHSDT